jgi:hypothetical protein
MPNVNETPRLRYAVNAPMPKRKAAVLAIAFVLASSPVACVKRTPCGETVGADYCSMVPEHYTCECDGRIETPRKDEQPVACGYVQTVCVGRVKRKRIPTQPLDLLWIRPRDAGSAQ